MLKLLYTNYVPYCIIMFYCIYDIVSLTIHDYLYHCVIAGGRHNSTLECLQVCLHDIIFLIIEIKSFLFLFLLTQYVNGIVGIFDYMYRVLLCLIMYLHFY